jgi:TolA-binding protein
VYIMSNRVEDLERQVAELQAAVNGLTEELVEMKERVRQLEDERSVGVEADAAGGSTEPVESAEPAPGTASGESDAEPAAASDGERTAHSDDHVDVFESVDDSADGDEATAEADGDDVIVPEQSATTPDAEAPTDEADEDDGESSEGDDIIVA